MLLPLLDVVFVGLVGADPGHVQNQLGTLLAKDSVTQKSAPAADINALTHQTAASPGVCKKIGADGIVASEIVVQHGQHSLVVVVYDGTGNLLSMSETPFAGKALAAGDLQMIQDNLGDDVAKLDQQGQEDHAQRLRRRTRQEEEERPAAACAPVAATAPMTAKSSEPELPESDDDPLAGTKPHAAAPQTAAATGDGPDASATATATPAPAGESHGHDLRAGIGLGIMSRSFSSGPAKITGFDTSAVGSVRVDVGAEIVPHLTAAATFERTISMHTATPTETDPTSITHWEGRVGYEVLHGTVKVTPQVGFGRRVFDLITTDPMATPNGDYLYLVIGGTATAELSSKITLFGSLAYEPVLGGVDIANNTLGDASRWGIDVAAGLEVRPITHIYVRAVGEYQSFAWSWQMASGAGSDAYPSAALQLGARY